jgi:outer membrane protein assembly factor BamD (BamD/ComL family)
MRGVLLLLACALALAACTPVAVKTAAPPIRTLAKEKQPAPSQLPIVRSEPVAPDPEKALEQYRKVLALNPSPETRIEALKRIADLQVQMSEAGGKPASSGLQEAIRNYDQLLQEQPQAPGNDRVLYQLARAYQNSGDTDRAIATLQRLVRQYPTSPLMADARFRAGELLYGRKRYAQAAVEYRAVMDLGPGVPLYEPAQYKYGWALFQQQRYAEALPVFAAILDRDLPPGELADPQAALAQVPPGKADLVSDSLRAADLALTALGGGAALNAYFDQHGEPRFAVLMYHALGAALLDKRRYTDAANVYAAYVSRHPQSPLAPAFQSKVIQAYQDGGFPDLVIREKERYVLAYEPAAAYWQGKTPSPEVMAQLRTHLEDLATYRQARAQAAPANDPQRREDFLAAAKWYQKILTLYPQDPARADVAMHEADALYDAGQTAEAAAAYRLVAYELPGNPHAAEAAYAAVQADQRLAKEVGPEQRAAVLSQSVADSRKLAEVFPAHPQRAAVLTRAAEDLASIKELDAAVDLATQVLAIQPPVASDLRRQALGVVADARFAQGRYAEAEAADSQLLALTPADDPLHATVVEQLAAAIYKQGEAARTAGDWRAAANDFARVAQLAPQAKLRANADYDAAAALVELKDWLAAIAALEAYRARYPDQALVADVDKKLVLAYTQTHQPAAAAAANLRIAARGSESRDTRQEAAWLAATLYDQAGQDAQAAAAYRAYLNAYPQPLDRVLMARRKLADYARRQGQQTEYLAQLRAIVAADESAGAARTEQTRLAAAQASLELGLAAAETARNLPIAAPVAKTLPTRKKATEEAIAALNRAAAYGFADTTPAATDALGSVYHDFAQALAASAPPPHLKGEALTQYQLLLEEQAQPFEDQALAAYQANLKRLSQGLWNPAIRHSVQALAELDPVHYAKREQTEEMYESLR